MGDKWIKSRFLICYSIVLIVIISICSVIGALIGEESGRNAAIGFGIGSLIGIFLFRVLVKIFPGFFVFVDKLLRLFLRMAHSWKKVLLAFVVMSVTGAGIILYHDNTYNEISRACSNAETARYLKQRIEFLQKGYKASQRIGLFIPEDTILFGKKLWGSNSIEVCDEVQAQLSIMLEHGECSDYILYDVPCKCGIADWNPVEPIEKCTQWKYLQCTTDPETNEDIIGCSTR